MSLGLYQRCKVGDGLDGRGVVDWHCKGTLQLWDGQVVSERKLGMLTQWYPNTLQELILLLVAVYLYVSVRLRVADQFVVVCFFDSGKNVQLEHQQSMSLLQGQHRQGVLQLRRKEVPDCLFVVPPVCRQGLPSFSVLQVAEVGEGVLKVWTRLTVDRNQEHSSPWTLAVDVEHGLAKSEGSKDEVEEDGWGIAWFKKVLCRQGIPFKLEAQKLVVLSVLDGRKVQLPSSQQGRLIDYQLNCPEGKIYLQSHALNEPTWKSHALGTCKLKLLVFFLEALLTDMKSSSRFGSIGELSGIVEEIVVSIETPEQN